MSQKLIIHIATNEWDLIRPNINYQDQQDEYQLKHRCRYRNNTRVPVQVYSTCMYHTTDQIFGKCSYRI